MISTHRTRSALVALVALLWVAGCLEQGPLDPDLSVPQDFTDPADLVTAHGAAIASMDADRYTELLEKPGPGERGFRRYPALPGAPELAWMTGDSWGYDEELAMVGHLLDPTYFSPELSASVASMEVSLYVTKQVPRDDGGVTLNCTLDATVQLYRPRTLSIQQPLVMELTHDNRGSLRIRSIREMSAMRGDLPGLPPAPRTWTELLASFRPPSDAYTEAAAVVSAHEQSLETKNFDRYAAMLAADFEYVPQNEDAADFPWLTLQHPWDRAEELGMIGHMMDPTFISDETGESVKSMEMALRISETRDLEGGVVEVSCYAAIQVLWAEGTGARADVRFVFTLAPDDSGYLRIRRIQEFPGHSRGQRVEDSSWASIKNVYR